MGNTRGGREHLFGRSSRRELRFVVVPETGGFGERVGKVAETLRSASPAIEQAMMRGGADQSLARDIIGGEYGRILGLGKAYWPFFYGLPFALMDLSGHHVRTLFEKGPSLEAHLGALDRSLQPDESRSVDFPHIAEGATASVKGLQANNVLRPDGVYSVYGSEEDPALSQYLADLSGSMLEAQYDKWDSLVTSLLSHSDTAVVGDVLHGLVRVTRKKREREGSITIPFNASTRPDDPTGFQLQLGEERDEYGNRRFVTFQLGRDSKMIGEGKKIRYLETSDVKQEGVCTIITDKTGQEHIQAWAYLPKPGVNTADLDKVFEAEETLHDLYSFTDNWDGNGAMGVMHEFKRNSRGWGRRTQQLDTLVATQIPSAEGLSGRLPLSILARNKEQLLACAKRGELRHIGEGKTYASVDVFLEMLQTELMRPVGQGRARVDEIATFYPPPLLDIIASRNEGVIRDILKTVRQTN